MTRRGYDSPESAAMEGFPPQYCRPIASRVNGDDAYVLLNTGSVAQPYLYGSDCRREHGRWFEMCSANGPGWHQTGHDPDVGTLSFWGDAPGEADTVRVEYQGEPFEEPVIDRAYLSVWWRVPIPSQWPRVTAFRIAGRWLDHPGPEIGSITWALALADRARRLSSDRRNTDKPNPRPRRTR